MRSIKNVASKIAHIVPGTLVITAMFASLVAATGFTTPSFAALPTASYSCGSYGSGNYSYTAGAADCGAVPSAPNTGFAQKLTQPSSLIAIIGSLLLILTGIVVLFKLRRKKQSIGFTSSEN